MLDGLMRGSILADADGIMREDVNYRNLRYSAQAHSAAHVIRENKERRAKRAHFREAHSVDYRGHGVLADADVPVPSPIISRSQIAPPSQKRLPRTPHIATSPTH